MRALRSIMRIIRIKRTVATKTSTGRRSIRQFAGEFFAKENHFEFAIEALIFGVLFAISTWPIAEAAEAITKFL